MRALLLLMVLAPVLADAGGSVEGTLTVKKDGKPGAVKNALVFLKGFKSKPPEKPAQMSQSGRSFQSVVLPVIFGGTVVFSNDEPDNTLYHHVFSPTKTPATIDSDKYKPGVKYVSKPLQVLGPVEVFCDIHREMISTVFVVPNDRYLVLATGEGSSAHFKIDGIPAGKQTLVGWHRSVKTMAELPVEIVEGQTTHVDLELDGSSGLEELLKNHKRLLDQDYGARKPDGGAVGEAVGIEDSWK